jgi:hypothetical protein
MGFNPLFAALFFPGNPHPPRCAVMLATGEGQVGVPIPNGSTWTASRSFRISALTGVSVADIEALNNGPDAA